MTPLIRDNKVILSLKNDKTTINTVSISMNCNNLLLSEIFTLTTSGPVINKYDVSCQSKCKLLAGCNLPLSEVDMAR